MKPAFLIEDGVQYSWRLAGYSVLAIPLSIMIVPAAALVPIYYTSQFGFTLASVGAALLLVRLFDAVTDPLVGFFSDRSRTSIGRRRPWMIVGAPILIIGVWLLFCPPEDPNLLFLILASAITYLGWTFIQIPYWSWGAEIGKTYNERTTVSSYRESAMVAGIALASLAPVIAAQFGHGIDRVTMLSLAVIVSVTLPIGLFISSTSFREVTATGEHAADWTALGRVLKYNKPFRQLTLAFAFIEFGKGASVAVMPFLLTYYFGQEELIGLVLLVPYILIVISAPIWLQISKRLGKHRAVALSLLLSAILLSAAVAPLSESNGLVFLGIECAVGLTAGGFAILPYAIVGDVADFYADQTRGDPMVATHFAAWSLVRKLILACAVGVALPLLSLVGFDPRDGELANSEITKWMFIALAAPFYLIGVILLLRFPITRQVHEAISNRLSARETDRDMGEIHGA